MSKSDSKLTADRARELLSYSHETGALTWRVNRSSAKAGNVAGRINEDGYYRVKIDRVEHYAHRVIWLMVHGEFPAEEIDHVNRDPADNRLDNLRPATRAENSFNRGVQSSSKSGIKGVHWNKSSRSWLAILRGKYLGSFPSKELALAARQQAESF